MGDKVGENPAALRAAVFLLSAKNCKGGVQTPPSRVKVNIRMCLWSRLGIKMHCNFTGSSKFDGPQNRLWIPRDEILATPLAATFLFRPCLGGEELGQSGTEKRVIDKRSARFCTLVHDFLL